MRESEHPNREHRDPNEPNEQAHEGGKTRSDGAPRDGGSDGSDAEGKCRQPKVTPARRELERSCEDKGGKHQGEDSEPAVDVVRCRVPRLLLTAAVDVTAIEPEETAEEDTDTYSTDQYGPIRVDRWRPSERQRPIANTNKSKPGRFEPSWFAIQGLLAVSAPRSLFSWLTTLNSSGCASTAPTVVRKSTGPTSRPQIAGMDCGCSSDATNRSSHVEATASPDSAQLTPRRCLPAVMRGSLFFREYVREHSGERPGDAVDVERLD